MPPTGQGSGDSAMEETLRLDRQACWWGYLQTTEGSGFPLFDAGCYLKMTLMSYSETVEVYFMFE